MAISEAPSRSGPNVYIDVAVPELDRLEVGESFEATFKCTLRSKSLDERRGQEPRKSYSIEVTNMQVGE